MITKKQVKPPEFGVHLTVILKEMAQRVKTNYETFPWSIDDWYQINDWTEDEQNDFHKWLTEYFYKNSKARKELLRTSIKNKEICKKAANDFIFRYGWKLKE
jgi:hypothetical protein